MNTIYDGSFVLGNTSATTYQAGPGISITQPSEGTVRISNDETVLWSGSTHTSGEVLTLSEPYSAFNTLKIYANGYTNTYQPQCNEFKLTTANEQIFYVLCENRPGSTPGIRFNYFEMSGLPDRSKIRINYAWQYSMTGTAITNTSGSNANINFIVGCNRISGGNA